MVLVVCQLLWSLLPGVEDVPVIVKHFLAYIEVVFRASPHMRCSSWSGYPSCGEGLVSLGSRGCDIPGTLLGLDTI